jgi:hypothetical protein
MRRVWPIIALVAVAACDRGLRRGADAPDLGSGAVDLADLGAPADLSSSVDDLSSVGGSDFASIANDLSSIANDLLSIANDLSPTSGSDLAPRPADLSPSANDLSTGGGGPINGGPCISGATGATAFRVRWANGGNTAYAVQEVFGLPDGSRRKAGAYGYSIGFQPSYVDPFLAQGGLLLDSSDFVDLELSTVGLSTIRSATLALYGRSFNTTTSGSFSWQTFDGIGATPTSSFPNSAPYTWSAGDMTAEISPGDNRVLIRIKAGGASGSLVVNRIELCLDAS